MDSDAVADAERPHRAAGAGAGAGGAALEEEGAEEDLASQRYLNRSCVEEGDCAVETAAILPFLSAPPRPVLLRPYKLPAGAAPPDPTVRARMQLGGRRRVKMLAGGSFKRHDPSAVTLGPTTEELKAIENAAALEEAQRLAALAEAETVAAAARIARSLPLKLPTDYEPLVLYRARERPAPVAAPAAADGAAGEGGGAAAGTDGPAAAADAGEERDVVVEDVMGVHLRLHQREGVSFVFDCVHGIKGAGING